MPDGDISIKLLENHWVQIRSGRSNTKMVGMARANYPQVPEFPTVAVTSIPLVALRTLIARTIFAISNEESRYTLNGALLILKAESLGMVATDGHRLSFVEKPGETLEGISGEKRVLVPRKALQELQVLLSSTEAEKVEFADDEHTLFFRIGHRTLARQALRPPESAPKKFPLILDCYAQRSKFPAPFHVKHSRTSFKGPRAFPARGHKLLRNRSSAR